jgi:elongation factor G
VTRRAQDDIPDELVAEAEAAREKLSDQDAEADDELMMKYLEGERLTQEELEKLLDQAIARSKVIPVFVGSATKLQGIEDLMDEIVTFFPSPQHTVRFRPTTVANPFSTEGPVSGPRLQDRERPLCRPDQLRQGRLRHSNPTELINSRTGKKERVVHVFKMTGKESVDIESALRRRHRGAHQARRCADQRHPLEKGDVQRWLRCRSPSLYQVAIVAKTKADEDKLGTALNKHRRRGPTLTLRRDEETHQTILSGVGDTAIDVVISKLTTASTSRQNSTDLRIPYRETIRKTARRKVATRSRPAAPASSGTAGCALSQTRGGYEFIDEIVGGRIPRQFIPAVDKGVQNTMVEGVLAGYPVVDVKVAVYDGSYHAVDSNEMAFRTAARIGFRIAADKADLVLLEPVAALIIDVPEEYAGAVMGDMSSRRGRILGMESVEGVQRIKAQVPYSEVVHYSPVLRSLSHGTGSYSIEIGDYAEVPYDLAKKVIEAYTKERAEGH